MKIVCLAYLHGYGGAEKAITNLSNNLYYLGNEVVLISLAKHNLQYELNENISVINIEERGKTKFTRILNRAFSLKKILNEIKPDTIVNFWFQSVYLCKILRLNYKIIYSERGNPSDSEYTGLLGIMRNYYIYKIDGVVFQSAAAKSYFDTTKLKNYAIIQNPVSITFEQYPMKICESNIIITAGRLHPQKNHKCLIDAFSKAHSLYPNYELHIYGYGELENELKEYCSEIKLDNVYFKGTTDEIYNKIYMSEIFVLSSDYEGMPNVLLEAMAIGKPCITTNFKPGNANEIIQDGVNGFIVDRNNSEMLCTKIIDLIKDKELKLRLSENAKRICYTNDSNSIYHIWNDFLKQLA